MVSCRGAEAIASLPLARFEREVTFLVLLAAATPTGGIPSEFAGPRRAGRMCARDCRRLRGCTPRRRGRRVRIPLQLGDPPASRLIGGLELLVLGGGQLTPEVFDGRT